MHLESCQLGHPHHTPGITVGTMGSPTIMSNTLLCNNSQNYTVTNQAGHSYRWIVGAG
ncbi:MAG: hypothetical protein U0176_14800 [Bacteroidia bacterium]